MTDKRFTLTNLKNAFQEMKCGIDDRGNTLTFNEVVDLLNEQHEQIQRLKQNINELIQIDVEEDLLKENEQLKQRITDIITIDARDYNDLYEEKEDWKSNCFKEVNQNQILWNEIHILMGQGAEPSDAFKKYLDDISTDYDKFWRRKLEQAKKR